MLTHQGLLEQVLDSLPERSRDVQNQRNNPVNPGSVPLTQESLAGREFAVAVLTSIRPDENILASRK